MNAVLEATPTGPEVGLATAPRVIRGLTDQLDALDPRLLISDEGRIAFAASEVAASAMNKTQPRPDAFLHASLSCGGGQGAGDQGQVKSPMTVDLAVTPGPTGRALGEGRSYLRRT